MKAKITEISNYLADTDLFQRWGGWCFNKTDKDLPYGVGITNTNKGTLYGYDDNYYCSGYCFVKNIESSASNSVLVTLGVYVFTPRTKWDEDMNTYAIPLKVYAYLKKKYKDVRFSMAQNENYVPNEVALIEVDFRAYGDCTIPAPVWWDFEGTLTIGEFEGEGEIMEYGYRSGWGDDYGSIVDFYTYYEYAGIYWTEGKLYVWGVDVTDLEIDGVWYNLGVYENGYTVFDIEENPFDGATAEIKIKGTPTEVWDYEGVMTVGEYIDGTWTHLKGAFFYYGNNKGSIAPETNYRLWFDVLNSQLFGLGLMTYTKIDNVLYNKSNFQTFGQQARGTLFIENIDHFPEVGETCTIKIKL